MQEKWAFEQERIVRDAAKRAIQAGHREFASIKWFVVKKSIVPENFSAARFAACITYLINNGSIYDELY